MKIYISGPISGYPDLNLPAFQEAATQLWLKYSNGEAFSFVPVSPHDNGLPKSASWDQHMRADIAMMMGCDAVCMLHGWEKSKGAAIERRIALEVGMTVRTLEDWLTLPISGT